MLVKEAKHLASIQTERATRSEMFRFHSHNIYYCYVGKRSETSDFHTDNGQQEAKCFASIPTIYTIVMLVKEAKHLASKDQ